MTTCFCRNIKLVLTFLQLQHFAGLKQKMSPIKRLLFHHSSDGGEDRTKPKHQKLSHYFSGNCPDMKPHAIGVFHLNLLTLWNFLLQYDLTVT